MGMKISYSNKIGNYSKGLPHNNLGEVDLAAYNSYLAAIRSGLPSDFESIILGGNTKLTGPQCGLAFAMEGMDAGNSFEPPCPAVASHERADEAVENYWMALLRDVPFTDYATNATALQACAELTSLSGFQGPRVNGQVTPQTLFRGFTGRGRCWTIRFTVPAPARTPGRASNGTALYDLRNRAGLYDGRWLLAGGAERSGPIRIECPRFAAAIPPRRSRC